MVVGRSREKFKEAVAQSVSDDEFGWRPVGVHGTQPATKFSPYAVAAVQGNVLKQSLCDAGQLNIDVVGLANQDVLPATPRPTPVQAVGCLFASSPVRRRWWECRDFAADR